MAKACTTEKTASRQRWIEEGLLELMQKDRFEDITVAALCRHLSLSRRSFYRYFEDLEDVLDSLMHHTFQDFASPNTVLNIRELQINFQFWLEHRSLVTVEKSEHSKFLRAERTEMLRAARIFQHFSFSKNGQFCV